MFYFCNGSVDCGSDRCPLGWSPQISSKVAGSNQSFHHKFKDLELIGLIAMVSVIITPQGSVALVWSCPHWRGPFEVGEIADEGQEPIICTVESNELGVGGGIFLLLGLPVWELLALALTTFLFGRTPGGRLSVLSGYHNSL